MKYRIGNNFIGRDDKLIVHSDSFNYEGIAATQYGRIANSGDSISFFTHLWTDKWLINDIYLDGFSNVTQDPMNVKITYYGCGEGEAYYTHTRANVTFTLGSVIGYERNYHSILSELLSITNGDSFFIKFHYDSTVGEETDYYCQNVIVEYTLK